MLASDLNPGKHPGGNASPFPLNQWYVAAFSKELKDAPLGRTLLSQAIVMFRDTSGKACALENRCCHRALPLSDGTLEEDGLRCGYHGLLFNGEGKCIEVPGQQKVPRKACVKPFFVEEQDDIIWLWFGDENNPSPTEPPPRYAVHTSGEYLYGGGVYHYDAPYQLIHDNLLDLSHLGYVHLKTIGGNASVHMNANMKVTDEGDVVRVVRHMLDSDPPPTYSAAYPFKTKIDRWQEIEFHVSHIRIWTGAVDAGSEPIDDPARGGFHQRGFHGVTPETETSSHYFWTIASNPQDNKDEVMKTVVDQTAYTFEEDKEIIESQYENLKRFDDCSLIDMHVDAAPVRARRIVQRLCTPQPQEA